MNINERNPYLDPEPCNFDPQILPNLILQQQLAKEKPTNTNRSFTLIQAGPKDINTVCDLYNKSPVEGMEVATIQVVVNPLFSEEFYPKIKLLEEKAKLPFFQPSWESESQFLGCLNTEESKMRKWVNDELHSIAIPVTGFPNVKVVGMFHGTRTSVLQSIFKVNLANLSTTDPGFFGSGVYHTSSAKYAYRYAKATGDGTLLYNWVCFSSAYPVIHHPDVKEDVRGSGEGWQMLSDELKKKHFVYLGGRQGPISGKYNAHYVLVCPKNANNPEEEFFFPCRQFEEEEGFQEKVIYDELVTFDVSQVLPRYLVTLGPNLLHTKSLSPLSSFHYQQTLQKIANLSTLMNILNQKIQNKSTTKDELTNEELIEYGHLLCLQNISDEEIKQQSVQYLEEKVALEKIRKKYRPHSPLVSFDNMFKPCSHLIHQGAAENSFEKVQNYMDEGEFDKALVDLIFLFSTNADVALCYTYLYQLFAHIKTLDNLANAMPCLIGRSIGMFAHHRQLFIEFARWHDKKKQFSEAISFYARALQIEESKKIHDEASKTFFSYLTCFFTHQDVQEAHLKQLKDQTFPWEAHLEQLKALESFCVKEKDGDFFYQLAKTELAKLTTDQKGYYLFSYYAAIANPPPFHPAVLTTTQRYWEAFKSFKAHFADKIDDIRDLQQKATESFIAFFKILFEDAKIILGEPPCEYDIRMGGSIGYGSVFPNSDLECIFLVSQMEDYFTSLIEVLQIQLLSVGMKLKFNPIAPKDGILDLSQKDFLASAKKSWKYSVLKTISLSTNKSDLFFNYQKSYFETFSLTLPKFDKKAFDKEWKEDQTLADIKKHYKIPLMKFLSDLALYHKIERTNILDMIDALPVVFTEYINTLLKECIELLYRLEFTYEEQKSVSSLPEHEIDCLQKCHWLILSPLSTSLYLNGILLDLELIARTKGFYLSYESQQFHRDMKKILVKEETGVKITGATSGYLHPDFVSTIFNEEGNLKSSYSTSAHQVCNIEDFHLKQKPSYPLMEYAIHSLCSRVAGDLTPCVELVRFDTKTTFYPVLISRTISGDYWKEDDLLDCKQWTRMLLCAILTRPADGRLANYIVKKQKIYCIENCLSFVEPAEVCSTSLSSFSKVNFFSLLFCMQPLNTSLDQEVLRMQPLNTPLDQEVLQEFEALDRTAILEGWIDDLIQKEKEYTRLFSEEERKTLFKEDSKGNSFTPFILFRKEALATLSLQFWRIQRWIRCSSERTAGDLLKELINIHDETVGTHVHNAYNNAMSYPFDQMKFQITSSKQVGSISHAEYQQAALGKKVTHEEIEKKSYSLEKAREEFFASLFKDFDDAVIIIRQEKTTIQANFLAIQDDTSRQTGLIQILEHSLTSKPDSIIFNHCETLDASLLTPFLHAELKHLDLSFCPKINDEALKKIHKLCPNLEYLSLVDTGITQIRKPGWVGWSCLEFSKLEYCDISNCKHLHTLQLKAPVLKTFLMKDIPFLKGCLNKEVLLIAIQQEADVLKYTDENLKKETRFILEAVRKNSAVLTFVDGELMSNKVFILAVLKECGLALQYVDENFKEDQDAVLAAVQRDGLALQYAHESLKKDKGVVKAAVQRTGKALQFAYESLTKDPDVVEHAVRSDGLALQYADESLKEYLEVILFAVKQNGHALQFVHDRFKNDKEVVKAAVQRSGRALQFADESLKKDLEVVLSAVNQNGNALEFVHESLKINIEVVKAAVQKHGMALQYADSSLKANKEVVLLAIHQNCEAFEYVDESLKKDPDIIAAASRKYVGIS